MDKIDEYKGHIIYKFGTLTYGKFFYGIGHLYDWFNTIDEVKDWIDKNQGKLQYRYTLKDLKRELFK